MTAARNFRKSFGQNLHKKILEWFPGHMGKGLKQMQQQLVNVDCIIEVHDARIPVSGRNELFRTKLLGVRPHFLVLNKCDLIAEDMRPLIVESMKKNGYAMDILFTDCRTSQGENVTKILPTVMNKMTDLFRYNRSDEKSFNLLIIGVPNVGKSSLINVMRNYHAKKKKATKVGAVAGITRSVLNRIKVSDEPLVYLLDTPGILEPQVRDVEAGFRLALCASMQDHLVGIINIADYLLYWLNKNGHFSYAEKLGFKEPFDDVVELLTLLAIKKNYFMKLKDPATGQLVQRPSINTAALEFVTLFRRGKLGLFVLDSDILQAQKKQV